MQHFMAPADPSSSSSAERPVAMSGSSGGAERPDSTMAERCAPTDTFAVVDLDQNPVIAAARARQRKRAQAVADQKLAEAEQQRARVKPKAAKKKSKRTAATTSDSAAQCGSKRQQRRLTTESFAASARDVSKSGATSSGSAARPAQTQQQSRTMFRLFNELKKLHDQSWIVDDAEVALKEMIEQARHLQIIPATRAVLRTPEIRALYTSICGALDPMHSGEGQDYTHVSLAACYALQEKVSRFLQGREEIEEATSERYPFLWELKSRAHDAVLNGLPIMPAFRFAAFPNLYAHLPPADSVKVPGVQC